MYSGMGYLVLVSYFETSFIGQMAINNNCGHSRSSFLEWSYIKVLDSLIITSFVSFVTLQCVSYISKCISDLSHFVLHHIHSLGLYLSD